MHPRTSVGRDFQDNILVRLMERGSVTTLYLRNRLTLRGRIVRFDPFVLLLDPLDGGPAQMVYKSAIVSISGPRQFRTTPPGAPHPPRRFGPRGEGGDGAGRPWQPPAERPAFRPPAPAPTAEGS